MKTENILRLIALAFLAISLDVCGDVETQWDDAQHISWYYTVTNGEATVYVQNVNSDYGDLVIPSKLGGYPVREMKWGIFKNYSAVTSVRVPGSIRKIPGEAFYVSRDTSLTNVVIESGCLDICMDSFIRCYKLEHVGIPNTVTNIGYEAFTLCKALKGVSIPDSVVTIEDRAFQQCEALEELSLGSGVKSIGETAFMNCNVLRSVVLPDGLEAIGTSAFAGCSVMQIDRIPASVRWIGSGAFSNCPESIFDLVTVPEVRLLDGWAVGSTYDVAGEVDLSGARGVADGVFRDQTKVTHVTLPAGLETIGLGLFNGCKELVSVTMPASLRKIDGYAFNGCTALETFVVPSGVTNIEGLAFKNCTSLKSITLPSELEFLGHSAFESCESLTAVEIPGGVKELPSEVFSRCSALATVKLPDGLERIRGAAFDYCPCIDKESLPGYGLVDGWLVEADIYTAEARIPSALRGLGDGVFEFHTYLTNAVVEGAFTEIPDGFFNGCSALRQVTLPESITRIGEFAFGSCTALDAAPIPEGVTSIGERAFVACAFTEVWVPSNVTEIAEKAFADCRNLRKAYLPIVLKGVVDEKSVFDGCFDAEIRYYLPDGSLEPVHPGECEVTVKVAEGQENRGYVTEGGLWKFGTTHTLKATLEAGTIFAGWYRNGAENPESTSLSYSIEVPEEDSVIYVAKFVSAEEDAESLKVNGLMETYELNGPFELALEIESFSPATATVTGLPKGLAYDAKTMTISGTPTTPGTYPVKVLLKNKTVTKGIDQTFTIVVKNLESKLITGLDPAPGAYKFVAGMQIPAITPKLAEEGWTLKAAGVPSGLKFDAKTGQITGASTAKPGAYTVTFTASKKGAPNAVATITVAIENRNLVLDPVGSGTGKVTGAGSYPAGKKVTLKATADTKDDGKKGTQRSVFAGWYRDAGCTMKADFGVDWRTPSVSYVTTDQHATFYARFEPVEADIAKIDFTVPDNGQMENGVAIKWIRIDVDDCLSLPTVKISGLPTGLKFTAKDILKKGSKTEVETPANTIYGTPTKSGVYTIVATVTTAGKSTASKSALAVVRKPGEYAVKATAVLANPVEGVIPGTVKGTGIYAPGAKVKLAATANKGYVFLYFDRGGLHHPNNYTFEMPEADPSCEAVFATLAEEAAALTTRVADEPLATETPLSKTVKCGISLEWRLEAEGITENAIAVSGLPTGLKFTAKTIPADAKKGTPEIPANTVYGTPTKASSLNKDGKTYKPNTVKVTVTTAGKQKIVYTVDLVVEPLPAWVVGTFNGGQFEVEDDRHIGAITFTVDAKGKISGKITEEDGIVWTVAAASFDACDLEKGEYYAELVATYKDTKARPAVTYTRTFETVISNGVTGGVLAASKPAAEDDGELEIEAGQDCWKTDYKADGEALFADGTKKFRVYDHVEADGLAEGQSLSLKIETTGKVTGVLTDATGTFTATTTLLPLTAPGVRPMAAEVYLVFLPNTTKKFEGLAVRAQLEFPAP